MPDIPDQDRILRCLIRKQRSVRRDSCRIAPVCHIAVSADLIDSLVFNSICFNLHKLDKGNFEIDYHEGKYGNDSWLTFELYPEFKFDGGKITGYFEYKNFSFVWYGAIPDSLCEISDRKREFPYWKGEKGDSIISVFLAYAHGSIKSMGMDCPDLDMRHSFYDED